jgi:ABC-type molybdenum transport system ATPase subunit/photorepair protein PhrA
VEQLVTAGTTSVVYVTHRPEEIPPSIRRSLLL